MKKLMLYISPLASWVFIIAALLFSLNQVLIFKGIEHWFLTGYLDDLVVLPVVLPIVTILLRIVSKSPKIELDLGMVITTFLMFSIVFEFVLPRFNDQHTADYYDVLCYGIGGAGYFIFRNY